MFSCWKSLRNDRLYPYLKRCLWKINKERNLLPVRIWEFQSAGVFLSTVPLWLASVFCSQNISLDYLYFQIWKNKPKRRTRSDSRKVALPGREWDLLTKRCLHRATKTACCKCVVVEGSAPTSNGPKQCWGCGSREGDLRFLWFPHPPALY